VLAVSASPGPALAEEAVPVAQGVTYQRLYRPEGPWAISIVEADLSRELIELRALLGGGDSTGRRAVPQMLSAQATPDRRPVAAVNADYFALAGRAYTTLPLGLHIQAGELVTFPDLNRSVLYLLADGTTHIDRFRPKTWLIGPGKLLFPLSGLNRPPDPGELTLLTPRFGKETRAGEAATQIVLESLSGPVTPNRDLMARVVSVSRGERRAIPAHGAVLVASGVAAYAVRNLKVGDEVTLRLTMEPSVEGMREAVSGGPRILRAGEISIENRAERFADAFATRRHPRTGVGLRDNTLVLVTVDGRQPGFSAGMTLRELAQLFRDLGCQEAVNLDGGGSTTMVVRDQVVNSPSDGQPRRVANSLALFTTAPTGTPVRLAIEPAEASLLSGDKIRLVAVGLDEYVNRVPLGGDGVQWQCSPSLGAVDAGGVFTAAEAKWPLTGLLAARWKDLAASTVVRILPAPARLTIVPARTSIKPGATQRFALRAFDEDSNPMRVPSARLTWAVEPREAGAAITQEGVLKACGRPACLRVVAAVGEASAAAEVLVGALTTTVMDFEQPCVVAFRGIPEAVTGGATVAEDPLQPDNRCLRLSYDFSQASDTRTAQAELNLTLPETRILSARVLGDGQGAWLRARLRDGAGRRFTVDLADRLDWKGAWKTVTGWLPEEAAQPVVLEAIYVTEYHAGRNPAGEVCVDDIGVGLVSVEGDQPGGGQRAAPRPQAGGT